MMDWKREIGIAYLVKKRTEEIDLDRLWDYAVPELAASFEEIKRAEEMAKIVFSDHQRDFLLSANGWRCFYQAVDLFGTKDYCGGDRFVRASSLLNSLEEIESICGLSKEKAIPVAVSMNDIDLFLTSRNPDLDGDSVYWFAGQLIERFDNFSEFFLSMVDYNRLTFEKLSGQEQSL